MGYITDALDKAFLKHLDDAIKKASESTKQELQGKNIFHVYLDDNLIGLVSEANTETGYEIQLLDDLSKDLDGKPRKGHVRVLLDNQEVFSSVSS